jgi:serine/threonine protein phosphatase PrpC
VFVSLPLKLSIGFESSAGVKEENQDAVNFSVPESPLLRSKGAVAVLADGVSSSEAARQASQTAVQSFIEDYYSTSDMWSTEHACQQVIGALNSWLYQQGISDANPLRGWVTTFDALIFKSNTVYVLHVGDARIYRLRDGELQQLTNDHLTWLNRDNRYLSRALGMDSNLQVDFSSHSLRQGDQFLMCSDGVYEHLGEQEFRQTLQSDLAVEEKAKKLLAMALHNQSTDNLSAQLIEVVQLPQVSEEEVYQQLTALPFPPDLEPGMILDGYQILQEVSLSPRSQIYLAQDIETREKRVLKTPSANYCDDPWYLDGFIREEWLGQRLKHPGLLKTYRATRPKQFLYFICEYIQGQTLTEWMRANPQPDYLTVIGFVEQIASALRALHRQDILHQDLKPDNILIDGNGRIKIIDFGAAKVAGVQEMATVLQRQHPEGTLHYTAPEYLLGEPASKRSDLFSLAVIVYEMLTGQLPFKEKQLQPFVLRSYSHLHYLSIRSLRPDLPDWVDAVLKKACAPNPMQRFALLSELLSNLRKPNADILIPQDYVPLIEKNPLLVWQGISAFLLLVILLQWWWFA